METLLPELTAEIFRKMDIKTANRFRSTSKYYNSQFLEVRKTLPKVDRGLYIVFSSAVVCIINVQRKWPTIRLVTHRKGPDDEAIRNFDLQQIVAIDQKEIVYETSRPISSLEKILTNMELYCRLEITIHNYGAWIDDIVPYSSWFLCAHCMEPTVLRLFLADELGRRVCWQCASHFKKHKKVRLCGNVKRDVLGYVFTMKAQICRTQLAIAVPKDDLLAHIARELQEITLKRKPLRYKIAHEDRPDFIRLFNRIQRVIPEELERKFELADDRTDSALIDGHRGRLQMWRLNGRVVLLSHDELFVANVIHAAEAEVNMNLLRFASGDQVSGWFVVFFLVIVSIKRILLFIFNLFK